MVEIFFFQVEIGETPLPPKKKEKTKPAHNSEKKKNSSKNRDIGRV